MSTHGLANGSWLYDLGILCGRLPTFSYWWQVVRSHRTVETRVAYDLELLEKHLACKNMSLVFFG